MTWFYIRNGNQVGPVSEQELGSRLEGGELTGQTLVWKEGMAEWLPAANLPDLAYYLRNAGTPGQPPPPLNPYQVSPASTHPAGPPLAVPSYLWQSIVVTLLCCWPLGIPAIVYASRVNTLLAQGNFPAAQEASTNAKTWCWVAFGCGIAAGLMWFLFALVSASLSQGQ